MTALNGCPGRVVAGVQPASLIALFETVFSATVYEGNSGIMFIKEYTNFGVYLLRAFQSNYFRLKFMANVELGI